MRVLCRSHLSRDKAVDVSAEVVQAAAGKPRAVPVLQRDRDEAAAVALQAFLHAHLHGRAPARLTVLALVPTWTAPRRRAIAAALSAAREQRLLIWPYPLQ